MSHELADSFQNLAEAVSGFVKAYERLEKRIEQNRWYNYSE